VSVTQFVVLIMIDIVIVAGISIGVGALAPRVSARYLGTEPFPLTFMPWERPAFFRALRVGQLARALPELGATFGGESKSQLPQRTAADMDRYLVELRRAEWVHWISIISWVPLAFFNPWWLTALFAVIVISGNTMFLLILRRNRQRLTALKRRLQNDI
jgi:glycosyl-4,4'-diaponeurosporenoate acyltransferase